MKRLQCLPFLLLLLLGCSKSVDVGAPLAQDAAVPTPVAPPPPTVPVPPEIPTLPQPPLTASALLPDGPRPRIWLTSDEMNRLVTKRDSFDPSWIALLAWCESHLNDAGYDIQPSNPVKFDLTNWGGNNNYSVGYRMSGFSTHLLNYAMAYRVLKAPGPGQNAAKAQAYATRVRNLLVDGIAKGLRVGEEDNGLRAIRVGSLHDVTINAAEAAALGNLKGGYKFGYSSRNIAAVPIAYDWIHDTLSAPDKEVLGNMMLRWFDWMRAKRTPYNNGVLSNGIRYHEDRDGDCAGANICTSLTGATTRAYAFGEIANNFGGGHAYLSLLIPVALFGDTPVGDSYFAVAKEFMNTTVIEPLESDVKHSGGDSPEGWNYGGGFIYTLLGLYGYYTATNDPAIPAMSWISRLVEASVHRTGANLNDVPLYGYWTGTPIGVSRIGPITRFVGIEQKLRPDSTLSGIGQYLTTQVNYSTSLEQWEALFLKSSSVAPVSPSTLPLAYLAKGNGLFMSRSSWNDPQAVHVTVRLEGKVTTSHEGADEGHISLARGSDRLLIHQNSIGDAPPSNSFNTIVFAGQSHHGSNPPQARPSIDRSEIGTGYSYVSGDITNAYKRTYKVDRAKFFRRSVLHIRPGILVIYDHTRSNPEIGNLKEWTTQYQAPPLVNEGTITATVGNSNIFVKTVYPTGGTFLVSSPKDGFYRVQYVPALLQEYDQFLHVVEAASSGANQISSQPIDVQIGDVRGVQVDNSVAVFSTNPDAMASSGVLSYAFSQAQATTHYLTLLNPGDRYDVMVSDGVLTCTPSEMGDYTVSANGLLVLSVSETGVVTQD